MSISVTVPNKKEYLEAAASFLAELADLSEGQFLPPIVSADGQTVNLPVDGTTRRFVAADIDGYKPESFPGAHDDSMTLSSADVAEIFGLPAAPSYDINRVVAGPGLVIEHAGDWQQADLTTPPMHPTTTSLLVGNGIPGYDGVPFDTPAPPLTAEQQATHTGLPMLPTPPTIISGVKLDGEGLPWDGRIHASTKTMRVSDNTWKLLKGVDKALVEKVKGELRVAMGLAMGPPASTPPALTLVPPLPPADDKGWPDPPPGPAVAPPAPSVPGPPASPLAPPAADPYPDFVQFCTSNQQSGRLQYQQIVDTCGKYGIMQLPMLNARHDLIPTIRAELESLCKPQ